MQAIKSEKVDTIFNAFKGKRILVIGDVMLDRYLRGKVSRISPEAPVPIVELESENYHFGGAANVALNLKSLGCEPITLGLIGEDTNAQVFLELIKSEQMDTSGFIKTSDRPTTVKTRIIGDNQHMVRVDREKIIYNNDKLHQQMVDRFEALIPQADAVILEDYNKGLLSKKFIHHILDYTTKHNLIVTVDPKFINFLEYRQATVFKPNIKEIAQALALPLEDQHQIEKAGLELVHKMQAKTVMLTRGAEGISLFEQNGTITHIPARTRKVADVSGAGDTVIATLTAALCAGATITEAALIANHAAGIVCGEVGIVPVKPEDIKLDLEWKINNA